MLTDLKNHSKERSSPNGGRYDVLIMGVVFTLYSIAVSFHILKNLNTHIAGYFHNNDLMGTFHLYWLWKKYMIHNWKMSLFTGFNLSNLFEYSGNTFRFAFEAKIYHFVNFIIFRFLELFFPFPAWYNVSVIISYGLNGFAFSILGLYLFKDRWAAAATGMIFSLASPVFISYMFGMNEVCWIFTLPLYFLCFIKVFEEKKDNWKYAIGAAFFAALATYFYWFFGIHLALFSLIFLVYYAWKSISRRELRKRILWGLIVPIIYFIVVAPFLYPIVHTKHELFEDKDNHRQFEDFKFNVKLKKDLSPTLLTMSSRSASIFYIISPEGYQFNLAFIPLAVTVCFLLSLCFIRRIPGIWYITAIIAYVLSLGPFLIKNSDLLNPLVKNPVYIFLLEHFRPFTYFRWPFRFSIFTEMALLVICGYLIINLNKKTSAKNPALKAIPSIILVAASLFQIHSHGMLPIPISRCCYPKFYLSILSKEENVKVIHLPFTSKKSLRMSSSLQKLTHEWISSDRINFYKTLYMKNSRYSLQDLKTDLLAENHYNNSFLQALANKSFGITDPNLKVTVKDYEDLYYNGYRYIVVHDQFFGKPEPDPGNPTRLSLYRFIIKLCGDEIDSGYDYENLCPASRNKVQFKKGVTKYWPSYLYRLPENITEKQLNTLFTQKRLKEKQEE